MQLWNFKIIRYWYLTDNKEDLVLEISVNPRTKSITPLYSSERHFEILKKEVSFLAVNKKKLVRVFDGEQTEIEAIHFLRFLKRFPWRD